ncbi:thiol reductant ABC exporter subunit CydC [Paenibacillus profundus]|uniref:Thiol reductant ABC exporter subunit CydC n=1 Tax=Paenibacillus profundus TaxID=1173085 RepID=A0ABS8YQB7_9BACL|nr:thiol reductant ABC exporter subunit CydC [Paenibacillus profundus]MCE5173134.1 thiol reductant ABC exporter subunit CydC [Paenibacillus profundus]
MRKEGWLRPYLRQHRWRLTLAAALGTLGVLSAALLLFISGYLISKAALRPENILLLFVPIVAVRAISIGQAVFRYLERLIGHDTVLRILSAMRVRLYHILEPQALFIRSRYRTGDILGVLSDDIEHLQDVYLRTIFPSIVSMVMYGLFILTLGMFHWQFAIFMALYAAMLLFALPLVSLSVTRKKHVRLTRGRNRLYRKLTDAVLGINDWLVSGRKTEFIQAYETSENELTQVERRVHAWARWRELIIQCVTGAAVVSMIIWTGHQSAAEHFSVTVIAAFVLSSLTIMNAFAPMSEAVEKIPKYQDSLRRIAEVGNDPESESGLADITDRQTQSVATAWRQVHLRLNHVSFRYPGSEDRILQDISLDIPPGKKVAIIGRSGAGKSTLLKLIQGAIQPEQGTITANGTEIHELEHHLTQVVSVLNQNPHLFDTTVANNIRLGRPDASEQQVQAAAAQAQLHPLIDSLPDGYHTRTHEMGQRFSGGERQRIALARILLQDNPIIVLDEPTVGLDPRTENVLLSTVFQAVQGKTLLWITHHLAGVEQMDEVIFLENGGVAMSGSHTQLMEQSARYRELYALDAVPSLSQV